MKTIYLTRNKETHVSDIDDDLCCHKWQCSQSGYAVRDIRENGIRKTIYLHRIILARILGRNLTNGEISDHIDRNTLNNQRENLRVASISQSVHNTKSKGGISGYKGVHWSNEKQCWVSRIMSERKDKTIGYYKSKELAAMAYDYWANKLHKEFAVLNFPDTLQDTISWFESYIPLQINNNSGYPGVYRNGNKWIARPTFRGKRKSLGTFDTPREAYEAIKSLAR